MLISGLKGLSYLLTQCYTSEGTWARQKVPRSNKYSLTTACLKVKLDLFIIEYN